jgi:hypothetical protein
VADVAPSADDFRHDWNKTCSFFSTKGRDDMKGIIQMVSGIAIGGAGFYQIAEHPIQGICALLLAGFLMMTGFENKLAGRPQEPAN